MHYTATYSPEDNKLRLYASSRLDSELYARIKAAGFRWAPKQDLFVAPAWSPSREDLLTELCGEIGDEDTSLVDRAEQRAERFEDYSDRRSGDAERAKEAVSAIADNIPFGQPILVGHHSEKRARKDAERIENGMRKAVKMWETSKYWTSRAAGAIRHAKYKELPRTRARRIKTIEADKRRQEREMTRLEKCLKLWNSELKRKDGGIATEREKALFITNYVDNMGSYCFPVAEYPRSSPEVSTYEGPKSLWSALDDGIITPEQAKELACKWKPENIERCNRWIAHFDNRLAYEKAMLEEQGAIDLIKPTPRPTQLPLLNYRAPEGLPVENMYHRGEYSTYPQIEMTKAEYAKICHEHRGTATIKNSHRVRVYYKVGGGEYARMVVFLTDSKIHEKPEPVAKKDIPAPMPRVSASCYTEPERTDFDAMKDTLAAGIKTVSAPQLFPTPPDIAAQMVGLAEIDPGQRILEPSAGTGNLLIEIIKAENCQFVDNKPEVVAVEINFNLAKMLRAQELAHRVECSDFLSCNGDLGTFDRIIMNPPFENAVDIKHIRHALGMLKPGGKLVALCANGPRQREAFKDIAEHWEDLPAGSFKNQGTGVNVALMVLAAPDPERELRELWDRQGISKERQNEIIRDCEQKAQPGAMAGPFKLE